ncbi:hypothetical protein pb186bvf_014908 [Paramecium bursaria]
MNLDLNFMLYSLQYFVIFLNVNNYVNLNGLNTPIMLLKLTNDDGKNEQR